MRTLAPLTLVLLVCVGCRPDPFPARGATPCEDGRAGPFHCKGIDLAHLLPPSELGVSGLNDLWGWRDEANDREYLIVGGIDGAVVVDATVPTEPSVLGRVSGSAPLIFGESNWRDIKVVGDHAFIGSEAGGFGVQVIDLTTLDGLSRDNPWQEIAPVAHYAGNDNNPLGHSHNLVSLAEDDLVAAVSATDSCDGGFHFIDVSEPAAPSFAGCVTGIGYVHDAQCVVYVGPDADHVGRRVCFAFSNVDPDSEDEPAEGELALARLVIVDVTDLDEPVVLSNSTYENGAYSHQGWLTEDHAFLIGNDEQDEIEFGLNTRTLVWDLSTLTAPRFLGGHAHGTAATDHNLYIRGGRAYLANYRAGLRVMELGDLTAVDMKQSAYFDTWPLDDRDGFQGAWGVYPFSDSFIAVTGIAEGLFLLAPLSAAP